MPSTRLPDRAALELSPSVESCGCGLGPSPVRLGEKVGLKLNIQKTKIMAYGPITSWEIDGETVETVSDFIFLGSKIAADGDCSDLGAQKNKV